MPKQSHGPQRAPARSRVWCAAVATVALAAYPPVRAASPSPAPAADPRTNGSTMAAAGGEPAPAASHRTRRFSFRQLGAKAPLQLRGVQGYYTLPFAVRADEVVARARLHLEYSWSPSLLEDLSHINVRINDEIAATLPVPHAKAGTTMRTDVDIPPQLVTEFSRLGLELVGHYARGCEDPTHSSLWAAVSNDSALELDVAHVDKANDLDLLPLPFFDRRESSRLELPIVFAQAPDLPALAAAGTVASWFGGLAGYRGAHFGSRESLPGTGNAVVMAVGDAALEAMGLVSPGGALQGPTVAVVAHPRDPGAKLLLVMGRNVGELRTAAMALAAGGSAFAGPAVTIDRFAALAPRKPYDAPNWLPADRPVHFGELAAPDLLGVAGESPDLIRVGFQLPPDLFGWRSRGIPVELRYRYSPRAVPDKSTLNINVNERFLQAVPLHTADHSVLARLVDRLLPSAVAALPGNGAAAASERLYIPLFMLPVQNQLQLHYFYEKPKQDTCHSAPVDNVRSEVDADSTLDISGFSHYLAMPDLAAFANSGFPFTRMADLSESAVVLPDAPGPVERDAYLTLMGRMGAATGYPAHEVTLVHAAQVDTVAGKDLLVIGSGPDQPLLRRWAGQLPISLDGAVKKVSLSDAVYRMVSGDIDRRAAPKPASGSMAFTGTGTDGMIVGFESPLAVGRSVVVVASNRPEGLDKVMETLLDPERLKQVQGSATLVRNDRIESLVADQSYFVGELPRITAAHWFFSRRPLLAALAALGAAGLISSVMYLLLSDRARHRLRRI